MTINYTNEAGKLETFTVPSGQTLKIEISAATGAYTWLGLCSEHGFYAGDDDLQLLWRVNHFEVS